MKKPQNTEQDETLLIALDQLGKALDMMQGLFARIEDHINESSADTEQSQTEIQVLTADKPIGSTVH